MVAKRNIPNKETKAQEIWLFLRKANFPNISFGCLNNNWYANTKRIIENIILKGMVFPQSGGEKDGGRFKRGNSNIVKKPIR